MDFRPSTQVGGHSWVVASRAKIDSLSCPGVFYMLVQIKIQVQS